MTDQETHPFNPPERRGQSVWIGEMWTQTKRNRVVIRSPHDLGKLYRFSNEYAGELMCMCVCLCVSKELRGKSPKRGENPPLTALTY